MRRKHYLSLAAAALTFTASPAAQVRAAGILEGLHRHTMLASTVTDNGDLNPYAVVIAPVSVGRIHQGDVLIDNFNNISNLQGTGTTILDYNPQSATTTLIASLPQRANGCPGGVGLTAAMTMLKSGWIIVGSTPSSDGSTRTRGPGCLLVVGPDGQISATWSGADIDGPWGNMAVIDHGGSATVFVSMAGKDVPGPGVLDPSSGYPVTLHKATVVRFDLSIEPGKSPVIQSRTVVADGLGQRADRDAFLIGPTGLALVGDGTLYVSDAVGNQIIAVDNAATRTTSAGEGRTITRDGLLHRPLALTLAPNGDLLASNAKNGQVVEIDPATGRQLCAQWIDTDEAQSPPGNGDLFGLAVAPDGRGFYYVEDDVNALMGTSP